MISNFMEITKEFKKFLPGITGHDSTVYLYSSNNNYSIIQKRIVYYSYGLRMKVVNTQSGCK